MLQVLFEGSMLFALEKTLRPSNLERLGMADPGAAGGDDGDGDSQSENKKEIECDRVMAKCYGELIFIGLYLLVIILLAVTAIY